TPGAPCCQMPCLPHLVHPVRRCSAPTKRLADVPQQYPWRLGSVACRGGPGCHWPCGCEQHLEQLCQSSYSNYLEIVLVSIVILNISKGNVLKSCKLSYLFPSGRRTGRCSRGIGRSGSLEGPRCQTAGTPKSSSSSSSAPSSSSSSAPSSSSSSSYSCSCSCSCSSAPGSSSASSSSSSSSATSASSSTRGA